LRSREAEIRNPNPSTAERTRGSRLAYDDAVEAASFLKKRLHEPARVGIVLGTGLGEAARQLQKKTTIAYKSIPHFPRLSVEGHAGALHLGIWGKVPVAVLEGRAHLYEGFAPAEVVFPVRVLALLGVKTLLLSCAAGGIGQFAAPGSFMILADHLNLHGANPLAGVDDPRWGTRFVDLTHAYDAELRRRARRAAAALRLKCFEGVYAGLPGPSYETPAEIRAVRTLGADAVGMSTVAEAIAARQLGLRVLAVAAITNRAAGLGVEALNHQEVLAAAKQAARDLGRLIEALLPKIV
jgi:purine-nucleoside phosphorylase